MPSTSEKGELLTGAIRIYSILFFPYTESKHTTIDTEDRHYVVISGSTFSLHRRSFNL